MVEGVLPSVVRIFTPGWEGTGVIFEVSGQNAYVLTAYHLLEGTTDVEVETAGEHRYEGSVIGYDAYKDLAVLSICCASFTAATIVNTEDLVKPGAEVISVGYSMSFAGDASVTRGIVSGVRWDTELSSWLIQTDAPINPGASGGPLMMRNGDVIGINSFFFYETLDGVPTEGLGFAVAGQTITDNLERLKSGTQIGWPTPTPYPTATPIPTRRPTLTPAQTSWETYENIRFRYKIEVPPDWVHEIEDDGRVVRLRTRNWDVVVNVFVPDYHIWDAKGRLQQFVDTQTESNYTFDLDTLEDYRDGQYDGAKFVAQSQWKSTSCIEDRWEYLVTKDGSLYWWISLSACVWSDVDVMWKVFESFRTRI